MLNTRICACAVSFVHRWLVKIVIHWLHLWEPKARYGSSLDLMVDAKGWQLNSRAILLYALGVF